MRYSFLLLLSLPTACGPTAPHNAARTAEAWDSPNNPALLGSHPGSGYGNYETTFAKLPLSGTASTIPWSDTYWPSNEGGIADRWQQPGSDSWTYPLLTASQVQAASSSQLKTLSPAEKYDIFVGRYDYPLTNAERQRTSASADSWNGLCHGWAPAGIAYKEPHPVTLTGVNGVKVQFGSSDIKALLTYYQQYQRTSADTPMVARRCDFDLAKTPDRANDPQCKDNNAGSFHIVLANQLGIRKQAFVADITRDIQVWNQPIYGYETKVLSTSNHPYAGAAPGTVKVLTVRTTMKYVIENGPRWDPVPPSSNPQELTQNVYDYTLELDAAGHILGGQWAQYSRPDFLWSQKSQPFNGYFARVQQIYNAATASEDALPAATAASDEASLTVAAGDVGTTAWLPTTAAPPPAGD